MFKVASYLSFKAPDMQDVLVAKLLDSKAKTKKRKDFTHHKHVGKELMLQCSILSHHVNPGFSFS